MFLNVTNHPITSWKKDQLDAAARLGGVIVDVPFPNIDPSMSARDLRVFAKKFLRERIMPLLSPLDRDVIHLMGETGFCAALSAELLKLSPRPVIVHSTTERIVEEETDGKKVSWFRFVQFRETFPEEEEEDA